MNQPVGRRILRPGHIIDIAAITLAIGVGLLLWIYSRTARPYLALCLALLAMALCGVVITHCARRVAHIRRKRLLPLAHCMYLADRLAYAPAQDLQRLASDILLGEHDCRYDGPALTCKGQPAVLVCLARPYERPLDAQDIIQCAETARLAGCARAFLAATSAADASAANAVEKTADVVITVLDIGSLADSAWQSGMYSDHAAVEGYLPAARQSRRSGRNLAGRFYSLRYPARLCICGVMLGLMARFSPFSTWYMVCSGLCFALGIALSLVTLRKSRQSGR